MKNMYKRQDTGKLKEPDNGMVKERYTYAKQEITKGSVPTTNLTKTATEYEDSWTQ